jgi:hypothetical protein
MALPKRKEIVFAAAMTALSAALLANTYSYPAASVQFPRFLVFLQLLFSLILLVRSISLPRDTAPGHTAGLVIPLQIFSAISGYIIAIDQIGYFVATSLFLTGSMYLFGRHRPFVLICVTAVFLLIVYVLFGLLIGVRLPAGLLV